MCSLIEIRRHSHCRELAIVTGPTVASLNYRNAKGIASTLVPDGHVQRVLDLKGLTLGGLWPDWVSLLPDDSPLLMLDRSTEEIDRLDLQYR
jgi:hypothetical protein